MIEARLKRIPRLCRVVRGDDDTESAFLETVLDNGCVAGLLDIHNECDARIIDNVDLRLPNWRVSSISSNLLAARIPDSPLRILDSPLRILDSPLRVLWRSNVLRLLRLSRSG